MTIAASWNVVKMVKNWVRGAWRIARQVLWTLCILALLLSFTPGASPWRHAVAGVANSVENRVARGLISVAYDIAREKGMLAPVAHLVIDYVVAYEEPVEAGIQRKYIELRNGEPLQGK